MHKILALNTNSLYTISIMIDETRVFSKLIAFCIIGMSIFYAVMTTLQLASGSPPVHQWAPAYPIEAISFFILVPALFIAGTKYPKVKLPAFIVFYFGLIITSVWFTEVYSPFTPIWSMFIVSTYLYYGWKGFIGGSAALIVMVLWYVLGFAGDHKPSFELYAVLSALVTTLTIATSYLFAKIISITRDKNIKLRESQHLEQVRANQLDTLLNSIREPVITVDANNIIFQQNNAVQTLFNVKASFVGQHVDEIVRIKGRDGTPKIVSQLIAETPMTLTRDDLILMSGTMERYVEVQITKIRQVNDVVDSGVVVQVRDITKQRTLEDEKDEFISVTSHELRTPIATIEGLLSNVEILRKKKVDDSRLDEAISTARNQIVGLARVVNDISTISRAEKGETDTIKDVDFGKLLLDIQTKLKAEADTKSLVLRLEIPQELPVVVTSYASLRTIIENFVRNGIRFTREGGVTIKAGILEDGRIYCDVIDTGVGIADEDKARIFDKFYRSEDFHTRETGGTGLGLYEAKILATKIDAYIQVVSEVSRGSVFRLTLPMKSIKYRPTIPPAPQLVENTQQLVTR